MTGAASPWRAAAAGVGLACGILAVATALAAPPKARPDDAATRGEAIVQRNCARCHAVGWVGDSPNPQAPRFRQLHERYDTDGLGEALAEGLTVGHGPMPEWEFGPRDNAAILAYLKSLERPPAPDREN